MAPHDDSLLRRYLLGTLEPASRDEIERRLFTDDQIFWERLCLVEEELIDAYVAGELDENLAGAFDRHFLCTDERRVKLEFARALAEHEGQRSTSVGLWDWLRRSVATPRWAVAAAAVLLLVLPGAVWRLAPGRSLPASVEAVLSPGRVRDAGERLERVVLPPSCGLVRLALEAAPGPFDCYRATLHEVSGAEIWSQQIVSGIAGRGVTTVTLTLPCDVLPEGDYWIRLSGLARGREPEILDRYDFRVIRPE